MSKQKMQKIICIEANISKKKKRPKKLPEKQWKKESIEFILQKRK